MTVKTGLEVLLDKGLHRGQTIGLITNHTGLGPDLRRDVDLLLERGYRLRALFSPEHGLYGDHREGQSVAGEKDPLTGIPVFSLYGEERSPSEAALKGLDCMFFDIQDIGARYYTYPTTMVLCMEAAAKAGTEFVVLDRPNPIGGIAVEGDVASPEDLSFVCGAPVAIRHGLTMGELATLVASEEGFPAPTVVTAQGWRRDVYFQDTGLPWVPPSPNAPTVEMALLYPGTCLIEGTNLSEGRGTSVPFQIAGAPWVDCDKLAEHLRSLRLPGVLVRPIHFRPTAGKWAGQECRGVQFHVRDPIAVRPVDLGINLLFAARDLHPGDFALREPPPDGRDFLDLLAAGSGLREALVQDDTPQRLLADWARQAGEFEERRRPHLLY